MGSDKAFLELAGTPLILRAIKLAGEISDDTRIVGDPQKFSKYANVTPDIFPGHGPLGGIHAALTASASDWNLILAVDLPFLTASFLRYLVAHGQSSGATVTVPSTRGYYHPLCALYRKRFADVAERALAQGKNKIDALYRDVPLGVISEEELSAGGFHPSMFRNLNTPEEWEQALREFGS